MVFGCTSKNFPEKIFLVFGKEEGKHKFRKTQATTQEKIIHDDKFSLMTAPSIAIRDRDRDRRRDRNLAFFARSRSTARSRSMARSRFEIAISLRRSRSPRSRSEITIDAARSRSTRRDRDLAKHCADRDRRGEIAISRSTARSRWTRRDRNRRLAIGGADWSSTGFAGNHQTGLELAFLTRARSLPFSGIHLK